jgi:hypothetical protein
VCCPSSADMDPKILAMINWTQNHCIAWFPTTRNN